MSVNEYGSLETPDCLPGFAKELAPTTGHGPDEEIWRRRTPDQASDYDDAAIRSTLAWLKYQPSDKLWVLFMPLLFPHCPLQVEEPYYIMYNKNSVGSGGSNPGVKTGYEPRYMQTIRERYSMGCASDEIWREINATYYGMIARLDTQSGKLVAAMDSLDLWKNTVTLFFTDHGEYLGDHGLIEKWPSGLSDTIVRELLLIDEPVWLPTILSQP